MHVLKFLAVHLVKLQFSRVLLPTNCHVHFPFYRRDFSNGVSIKFNFKRSNKALRGVEVLKPIDTSVSYAVEFNSYHLTVCL